MNENFSESRVFTVSEITGSIKEILESNPALNNIWIKGEIYNLTYHSSGHVYFSLKDEKALISAVFFRYAASRLKFRLEAGMSVFVFGNITLFEKRGSYQVNVLQVKLEGIGELQKRIEQLKEKLNKEGIFDPSKKRPLPFLPGRIGVVTSPTGAAFRDIVKVALRRYSGMEIILAPAKVQGDDAPDTIVRGIEELNRPEYGIDVIIAGRGGGSFEDLLPFSEEAVIRAFSRSVIPIVSAVGHQIDHPLSDDAADAAAPTPSAAAELVVPSKKELRDEVEYLFIRMNNRLQWTLTSLKQRLENVTEKRVMRDPYELLRNSEMLLTDSENRMVSQLKEIVSEKRRGFMEVPDIGRIMNTLLSRKREEYNSMLRLLDKLSPLNVMKRGYSVARDRKMKLIKSIDDIETGEELTLQLYRGSLKCRVNSKEEGGTIGKEKNS
jgi:exodeoxyribonuclease VII large subunit